MSRATLSDVRCVPGPPAASAEIVVPDARHAARTEARPNVLPPTNQSPPGEMTHAVHMPQARCGSRLPSSSAAQSAGAESLAAVFATNRISPLVRSPSLQAPLLWLRQSATQQSRAPRRQLRADDFAGGMILGATNNFHAPSVFRNHIPLGNGFRCVISALGLYIRPNLANDCPHIHFRENDHGIDVFKRRYHLSPFFHRHDRTAFSLERAYRFVGIDRDHQLSAKFFGSAQITHVAHMQQIEAAVG